MTHKANCDRCKYVEVFGSPLRSYEMDETRTVRMELTFVWCASCQGIRWGEVLPDLAELERELEAARPDNAELIAWLTVLGGKWEPRTGDELLARHVDELRQRLAWRRARKLPPRCLECGSVEVTPLAQSETRSGNDRWRLAAHPGCGGMITVLQRPVLALDRRWIRYTPEGELKQGYEMYPGRGAVPIDKNGNE